MRVDQYICIECGIIYEPHPTVSASALVIGMDGGCECNSLRVSCWEAYKWALNIDMSLLEGAREYVRQVQGSTSVTYYGRPATAQWTI